MLRYLIILISFSLLMPAQASRLALVIGNGNYNPSFNQLGLGALANPGNDATDVAKVLQKLGFEVILRTDATRKTMRRAMHNFSQRLEQQSGGVGLFYFSGHGFQYNNINYLLPLRADIQHSVDIDSESFRANEMLLRMEGANQHGVNLVIMDACRSSIPANFFREGKGFSKGGFTSMQAPIGSLIAYSTAPNTTSWGGLPNERNSVYTKHLLQALQQKAHLDIAGLFRQVRKGVIQETRNTEEIQVPWESTSLTDSFYFAVQDGGNEPGTVFQDRLKKGGVGPEMVVIPAGRFRMGDIQGGGNSDEKPVHWVNIQQFAMGKFEVTVGEFRQFVNATYYKTEAEKGDGCYVYDDGWKKKKDANWRNPYFSQNDKHPVVCVSWNDATAYAEWLNQQTGKQYRLPSEAEWEYAARAGTETKYWWGNKIGHNRANCFENQCGDNFKYTAPVGSFDPNSFGLYDTVGNVWEWIADSWSEDYTNAPNDGKIRTVGVNESYRVLRGGSWGLNSLNTRAADRSRNDPDSRDSFVGFRVVRRVARTH